MRKAIPSPLEDEATSDPLYIMADASTIVLDNSNGQENHASTTGEGGGKSASAEFNPLSGFGSDVKCDGDATTSMMVLGKSTDGSLKLYQSSYPNGTGIDKASPAQQVWGQNKACHDDLDAVLDPFCEKIGPPKHAGLAEQVQRRGLWAGP